MQRTISFGSDNHSGMHPRVLQALAEANSGHTPAYGDDPWTAEAQDILRQHFGPQANSYFVFLGTGANVLALRSVTRGFHAVICAETAHIHVDECGAPESVAGVKLLAVPTPDGKLKPQDLTPHLHSLGFEHHSQPRVLSITQATELGTVYRPQEIRDLAQAAHDNGLILHMDGARLANAAAFLETDLHALTTSAGVDILSLGGAKNGLMAAEAVVFLTPGLDQDFKYLRKQGMQLASKMRFLSAQFTALMRDGLWLENARQANAMARLLATGLEDLGISLARPVEGNAVFALLPPKVIDALLKEHIFYTWKQNAAPGLDEARLMCSFDTAEADVQQFLRDVRAALTSV